MTEWNEVLRKLNRRGTDKRETLVDIVNDYSSVDGKKLEELKVFIKDSNKKELGHMVYTLDEALRDRMDGINKQSWIYLDDLGLIYDKNKFIYRLKEEWEGGRRRRRRKSRRKSKRRRTKKKRRRRRKSTKKKRRRKNN